MTSPVSLLRFALAGMACAVSAAALAAPTEFKVVHDIGTDIVLRTFNDAIEHDAPPTLGRDGKFYGTIASYKGGLNVDPVLGVEVNGWVCQFYRLDPTSGAYEVLAEIDSKTLRMGSPEPGGAVGTSKVCAEPVQAADGLWYGTTFGGGTHHAGKIWRYSASGTVEVLYNFPGAIRNGEFADSGAEGAFPATAPVQGPDGLFYGTTTRGGANGVGTLFSFDPASGVTVLHNFDVVPGTSTRASSLLKVSADKSRLVGVLNIRRGIDVFTLPFASRTYSVLFTSTLDTPTGLAEAPSGDWYLVTYSGEFYRYQAATGTVTNTSKLAANNTPYGGVGANGLLLAADGNFYGTILFGGANASGAANGNNTGSIFRLKQDGSYEILHMLAPLTNGKLSEGAFAAGGLSQGPDDRLFGVATAGGANARGAIFSMLPGDPIAPQIQLSLIGSGANPTIPNYPDPFTIVLGQSATVRWSGVQARSCVAGNTWPEPGAIASSGEATLKPVAAGTYLYTIVCENEEAPGETLSASLSLTVLPVKPAEESFGSGGGGALPLGLLLSLGVLGVAAAAGRRRRSSLS